MIPRAHPTLVEELAKEDTSDISTGHFHAMALTFSNKVFNWGYRQARIGNAITNRFEEVIGFESIGDNHQKVPQEISKGYVSGDDHIIKIESGANNNAILTKSGRLYIWGDNSSFQVGEEKFSSFPVTPIIQEEVLKMSIRDVSIGEDHIIVLDFKGTMFFKGSNKNGEVGVHTEEEFYKKFQELDVDLGQIVKVYAGDGVSYAIDRDGGLWCAGRRLNGFKGKIKDNWWKLDIGEFKVRNLYVGINNLCLMG